MSVKNSAEMTPDDDEVYRPKRGSKSEEKEELFQNALAVVSGKIFLTRNKSREMYATFLEEAGYVETVAVNAPRFASVIRRLVRVGLKIRPSKALVEELVEELREDADSGTLECHEVHNRVALGARGQYFIDLCNGKGEVIEVDALGCRLHDGETEMPLFLRKQGMTALPNPIGQPARLELLRKYLNLGSDAQWRLVVVFLLYSHRPNGPYVILVIFGSAGSSKSTFCRTVRSLIDPSSVPTQSVPKSIADLMITASNSHLQAFDNVRELSDEMSDAFCRLATGGGARTRALYTNGEETLFHVTKPCLLNGIHGVATQPDLLSRCIHLELPAITVRRTEEEFNRSLEGDIASIFAGLMEALSKTLAALPDITEVPETRMADFSRFGMAVERALGWPQDSFRQAYEQNQAEQMWNTLADDPLALAVKALVSDDRADEDDEGEGDEVEKTNTYTPTKLLAALDRIATREQRLSKAWPKSPLSLGKRLRNMEPALRACGVGVEAAHSGNRTFTLRRLAGFKP